LLVPLHGHRVRKGVFVTTSTGTREALGYTAQIDTKIVLVDGRTLARLMIPHDVGCAPAQSFVVKKLDSDDVVEECGDGIRYGKTRGVSSPARGVYCRPLLVRGGVVSRGLCHGNPAVFR
jgi:hypothetical protein